MSEKKNAACSLCHPCSAPWVPILSTDLVIRTMGVDHEICTVGTDLYTTGARGLPILSTDPGSALWVLRMGADPEHRSVIRTMVADLAIRTMVADLAPHLGARK